MKAKARKALISEIKELATRQGFMTEEQIDEKLGDDFDEKTSDVIDDIFLALNTAKIQVYRDEEEAKEKEQG